MAKFRFKNLRKAPVAFNGGKVRFLPGEETEVDDQDLLDVLKTDKTLQGYVGVGEVLDLDGLLTEKESESGRRANMTKEERRVRDSMLPDSGLTVDGKPVVPEKPAFFGAGKKKMGPGEE